MSTIKEKLIAAGVKNLKEFGYEHVDENTILTDEVYSRFFEKMLNQNKGHSELIDAEIDAILTDIKSHQ